MKKVLMMAVGLVSLLQASDGAAPAASAGGSVGDEKYDAEIGVTKREVPGRSQTERNMDAYGALPEDETAFQDRLRKGFERRDSVKDFRSLESKGKLPVQPGKFGDATKILSGMYDEIKKDIEGLLGSVERGPDEQGKYCNVQSSIVKKIEEESGVVSRGPTIAWLGSLEEDQKMSLGAKIKKLTEFRNAVILAHADLGIDIRCSADAGGD